MWGRENEYDRRHTYCDRYSKYTLETLSCSGGYGMFSTTVGTELKVSLVEQTEDSSTGRAVEVQLVAMTRSQPNNSAENGTACMFWQ